MIRAEARIIVEWLVAIRGSARLHAGPSGIGAIRT
jgi:hypothetical protein